MEMDHWDEQRRLDRERREQRLYDAYQESLRNPPLPDAPKPMQCTVGMFIDCDPQDSRSFANQFVEWLFEAAASRRLDEDCDVLTDAAIGFVSANARYVSECRAAAGQPIEQWFEANTVSAIGSHFANDEAVVRSVTMRLEQLRWEIDRFEEYNRDDDAFISRVIEPTLLKAINRTLDYIQHYERDNCLLHFLKAKELLTTMRRVMYALAIRA